MSRVAETLSLTEFKRDTSHALKRLRTSKKPQVLAVNGRASFVVQEAGAYRQLVKRLTAAEERLAVTEALIATDRGERGATIDAVFRRVAKRAAARRRPRT